MTPYYDPSELRRRFWRARVAVAALVAPRGMTIARGELRPGAGQAMDQSSLEHLVDEARRLSEASFRERERRREAALDEATQRLLLASNEARENGDPAQASEQLRQLLLRNPGHAHAWHLYALRLTEAGQYDAAFEAFKNALQINPANLDAMEVFLDAAFGRAERRTAVDAALSAMVSVLPQHPEQHRRSLDILIPAGRTDAVQVLSSSTDRVTRAIVTRWNEDYRSAGGSDESQNTWEKPAWLSSHEFRAAQMLYSLQHGRRSRAIALIRLMEPQSVSRWSLRMAIRRDLRANQYKGAQRLLREYLRLEPEDQWARTQALKLGRSSDPTNYQLARQGFPFPPARRSPVYTPKSNRVLYLLHNSLPYHSAGYSTRTHGLITGLRQEGWDVQGMTRLGYPYDMPKMAELGEIPPEDVVDGVPYHRLSTIPGIEKKRPITRYVGRYTTALELAARNHRPFLLHGASNHWNGLATVTTARKLGIPSIYEVRGLWEVTRGSRDPQWAQGGMYRFMARMEADAAANATRVLAITQALKDELVERGVDESKISVVPNAVDAGRFSPQSRNADLETRLGLGGKTVIGYIGSVLDYEGLRLLVDAATVLRTRRQDFAVLVVGDGAELESFQALVRERQLEDVVIFTGRVPHAEVEQYYSLVDIAPFPRLPLPVCEMVSPLKPFEALAMGKAVVASDVAALSEIIQHGVNGLLHRKGDASDLTRRLESLLDDPGLRADLAASGREWVREHRQWSDMAHIVSGIYEDLGGRRTVKAEEQTS